MLRAPSFLYSRLNSFVLKTQFYSAYSHKLLFAMNKAYFRHSPEENQLQINFRYINSEFKIDRDFNFCRSFNETVKTGLDRIKNNLEKEFNKKHKKKKSPKKTEENQGETNFLPLPEVSIQLLKSNQQISDELAFSDIFPSIENENLVLRILDDEYEILYNQPWVTNVVLPNSMLAGYYVYPTKLEMQFATREKSKGVWYRGILPKLKDSTLIQWEKIQEGLTYCTKTEDIGYIIKFEIIPGNGTSFGPSVEILSKCEVQAGPGRCPFEDRHMFTQSYLSCDKFRVITYNLLADYYADSDYSRKELFPYCPEYALNIDYRKQLYVKEILGYHGDVICLQEVDSKIFDLELIPIFESKNYSGILQKKGTTAEGVAIFFRNNRFELIKQLAINIGENIIKLDVFNELWLKIKNNKPLADRITDRATTLQVVVLKSKDTDNYLIVANTHLYFHPDADHIRLLQIGFSMIYVENVFNEIVKEFQLQNNQVSILFCGDFNSTPECGIYKLMTEKYVDSDFIDWTSNKEEAVKNVTLSQPFNIASACGTPSYTNYTHMFSGCLDYIFYQTDTLQTDEIIPLPSDEDLKAHIAIPSVVFPSDHVALVADFKWKVKDS